MIETLAWPHSDDCNRLKEIQQCICNGARLIELGAGVGVVGTYLSAIGSQVLLTDLPTLVENAIDCNLARNEKITALISNTNTDTPAKTCPQWLPDGVQMGNGWAATFSLDWTQPLNEQLTTEQSSAIDFVVASDVVFLVSMLNSLFDTVDSIFKASSNNNPSFILSFQRRDAKEGEESSSFTTVKGVMSAVEDRGWICECLAWRPVAVRKEESDGTVTDAKSEVFVFEIKPKSS